ncbi:MAG TPA: methionine--tRNA ligase subunit beta [Phycisphaerae bacterium]|jgi:methionyl-tRNA synthetase|nr:methionine--tRNA ligase subunit beta [Phycisphaerae bacterium]HPM23091.1 methionine--tRNA ligase subunit beta [Phycisphaerae bacterium]HQL53283.1 methionine--tRNA ligase subunit beta [Phycisphaerae bacterium]
MSETPAIIQFDDFLKLDLRVATVLQAEPHPAADKLLVLQVDLGTEQRQIIAGIRGYYEPAALVGKQIIVVANLAPRKMRGLDSNGMLLAATSPDHTQVILLTTERPIAAGARVS